MKTRTRALATVMLLSPFAATDTRLTAQGDGDPPRVATAEIGFALDFFKAMTAGAPRESNAVVGTISLHTALAMTAAGATGETKAQLDRLLRLSEDFTAADWDRFRNALQPRMLWQPGQKRGEAPKRPSFVFDEANRVFGHREVAWHDSFRQALSTNFEADLTPIDFLDPQTARQEINDWIARQTKGQIKDLIGEGVLTPDLRMALVNACRFHASWPKPFRKQRTTDASFTTLTGETVEVPTLHGTLSAATGNLGDALVVDLPFEGSDTSLLIVMPAAADGLPDFEASLDADLYAKALATIDYRTIDLALPKLDLGTKAEVGDLLKGLGARKPFSSEAEFGGMAEERLMIGPVLHEARLKLDEKGVEATAATVVLMARGSIESNPPQKVAIDRPFWFAVRHRNTGAILFTGRVVDPSPTKG